MNTIERIISENPMSIEIQNKRLREIAFDYTSRLEKIKEDVRTEKVSIKKIANEYEFLKRDLNAIKDHFLQNFNVNLQDSIDQYKKMYL